MCESVSRSENTPHEEENEISLIVGSDAGSREKTVVVSLQHASVTQRTVVAPGRTQPVAGGARRPRPVGVGQGVAGTAVLLFCVELDEVREAGVVAPSGSGLEQLVHLVSGVRVR